MASTISFKKTPAAPAPADAAAPAQQPVKATGTTIAAETVTPIALPPQAFPAIVSAQVVTQQSTQLAGPDQYKGVGGFEGEFTAKDMATPYLVIMQKQSKNFDEHMSWLGNWVYDKEVPLGEEIKVVFIRASKYYVEDLPFESKQIPAKFTKLEDARAAGFNHARLKETADLDLLIEVDGTAEGVADLAHIIDGDKGYILARYSVRSTAYGRTVGIIAKDHTGFLKGNLINGFYMMKTERRQNTETSWYVPSLRVAGKTPDSLKNMIVSRMTLES